MALRQIRIGSLLNVHQYDDGDYDKSMEVEDPISCTAAPIAANDVVRLTDLASVFAFPVAAANIDDPTELNTVVGVVGSLVLAYKVNAATVIDEWTLYAYDASGPVVSSPYVVDAAGAGAERWVAIAGKYRISIILNTLPTKNPPIDADKVVYRNSVASDGLVTSTWTQVKAFLKTYFDGLYGTLGTSHNRLHSIIDTGDHTSAATSGQILQANANGLPVDATNTNAAVAAAVSASHSNALDHTQGTDTALGTQAEALDMGGFVINNLADPVLETDAANKDYVDIAVSSLSITEFFSAVASDIGGIYYVMSTDVPASATVTSAAVSGADQNIFNFATKAGKPNLSRLVAGVYTGHIHVWMDSAGAVLELYYKIFKRVGVTDTLITGSQSASITVPTASTMFNIHSVIATEEALNVTDRIVIKWYASLISGAGTKTVSISISGTDDSYFAIRVPSQDLKALYVPYVGAEDNVNLGTNTLTIGSVEDWRYAAPIADDGTKTLPTILANYAAIVNVIISSVGVIDANATFMIDSTGTVTPQVDSGNCVYNVDTDVKLCIGTSVANPLIIKYRLGSAVAKIMITMKYVKA